MTKKSRILAAVLKSAQTEKVELPWQRGPRRKAFIAKREATQSRLKSA